MEADGRTLPDHGRRPQPALRRLSVALHADRRRERSSSAAPDWYYNFPEYDEEHERGYDYHEDLLTTGLFRARHCTKGQPVVFSCSTPEEVTSPASFDGRRSREAARQSERSTSYLACRSLGPRSSSSATATVPRSSPVIRGSALGPRHLHRAAGRHADARAMRQPAREVLDTLSLKDPQEGPVPEHGHRLQFGRRSAVVLLGAPASSTSLPPAPRKSGRSTATTMKAILEAYRDGSEPRTCAVDRNGLVWASHPRSRDDVDGRRSGRRGPVTRPRRLSGRSQCAVVQRRALCAASWHGTSKDTAFVEAVGTDCPNESRRVVPRTVLVRARRSYLADYVDEHGREHVHPSPTRSSPARCPTACSARAMKRSVIDTVRRHLLTPKGSAHALAPAIRSTRDAA